jgi:transcriptional regulator with PAS, ATPase and Fis domain
MTSEKEFVEFQENPYNPESKGPEEIVRLFYVNNVPILPVVSKRGLLLGILTKENVISELSDIERVGKQKIDAFVMKILKKISLDELLPVAGNVKEFPVINLFGEIYGKWSRLELFTACEKSGTGHAGASPDKEAQKQRDEQALEWMIYLVLEHIPRALYAINDKGRTVFFNNHFEDIFSSVDGKEVDANFVETSLADPKRNDFFYRKKDNKDIYFYNKDMNFYYEKIPLMSDDKNVGYLIFVDKFPGEGKAILPAPDANAKSLNEMLESVERSIIVDSLNQNGNNIKEAAKNLKLTAKALTAKIEKHGIKL